MNLNKKYTIYLMQHSHTDIGYTKSPELTLNEQVDYIYYLLDKFDQIEHNQINGYDNYKWVCESFVIIDRFINDATDDDINRFVKHIKNGKIEVTAMYANLAQVLDASILKRMINRAVKFGYDYDISITSAMNADINGISRDYARALSENGIHDYFICVHTHHGMYPLFEKQTGFKWDLGDGHYLNVWNGEHYMFGNGFAFSKGAISVHGFFDDVDFKKYNLASDDSWLMLAQNRFEKYITKLEQDGYNYDFIPLTIHGKFTDNSMPNLDISRRVDMWNEKYGEQIEVKMCTLNEFFKTFNKCTDLPSYSGEWPDWWTDGVISAPAQLKLFKNAQTQYLNMQALCNQDSTYNELFNNIDYDLTMYAEHTYGSFDSISNPYHDFTHRQWALKQNYLSNALRAIDKLEHNILKSKGKSGTLAKVSNSFKIINPSKQRISRLVHVPFDNSDADNLTGNYHIYDDSNNVYSYTITNDWRKFPIIDVTLEPSEERIIYIKPLSEQKNENRPYFSRHNMRGSDNVFDLDFLENDYRITNNQITTNNMTISYDSRGIYSIVKDECELLDNTQGLLTLIYEVSQTERHLLGRNRKGSDVKRSYGQLIAHKVVFQNKLFVTIEFTFKAQGFNQITLLVNVYPNKNHIDFKLQLEKQISADVENVFLALPFKQKDIILGQGATTNQVWTDQLPGTLIDYYPCYKGLVINNVGALSTPDSHLIQTGSIDPMPRILYDDMRMDECPENIYIWLMSNYWETNFVKSLAGFYEFNYRLDLDKTNDNQAMIEKVATDPIIFQIDK